MELMACCIPVRAGTHWVEADRKCGLGAPLESGHWLRACMIPDIYLQHPTPSLQNFVGLAGCMN